MHQSDSIKNLASALHRAQGDNDPHAETLAILPLCKRVASNRKRESFTPVFFERVAFGLTECWHWVGSRSEIGYGMIASARNAYGLPEVMAHRVSWHIFNGPIPMGMKVLHRCDVRSCVNPDHLFLGTQADNVRDMMAKGRGRSVPRCGASNPMARMTDSMVNDIRQEYAMGNISQKELGKKFGVSTMTINRAVRRISWNHA